MSTLAELNLMRQYNINRNKALLPVNVNQLIRPVNPIRRRLRNIRRRARRNARLDVLQTLPIQNLSLNRPNRGIRRNVRMLQNQMGVRRPIRSNRIRYSTIGGGQSGEIVANNTETIGTCSAGMNYFEIKPGQSGALVLDKLSDLYDLYSPVSVTFHVKSATGSLKDGQYRAAIDYNGTLPQSPNQIEAMTNSKIDNIYKNNSLVAKRDTLNKVLKYSTYDPENPDRSQFQTTACTLCVYVDPTILNVPALTVQVTYSIRFYTIKSILAEEEPTSTAISQIVEVPGNPQLTPSIILSQNDSVVVDNASAQSLSENATVDSFELSNISVGSKYSFGSTVGSTTPTIRLRDSDGNIIPPSDYKILPINPSFKVAGKILDTHMYSVYNYNDSYKIENLRKSGNFPAGPIAIIAGIIEIVSIAATTAQVILDIVRPWLSNSALYEEQNLLFDAVSAVSPGTSIDLIVPEPTSQEVFDNFNNYDSVYFQYDGTSSPTNSLVSINNEAPFSNLKASKITMTITNPVHDPASQTFTLTTTNQSTGTLFPGAPTASGDSNLVINLYYTDSTNLFKIGQNYTVFASTGPVVGNSNVLPFGRLMNVGESGSNTQNVLPYNNDSGLQYVQNFTVTSESTASDYYVLSFEVDPNVLVNWNLGIVGGPEDFRVLINFNISDIAA